MNKLVLTGLLAAGTMTHLQGAQPAGQRPNILFILSDDHTSQAWGIYGGVLAEYAHNANIRRLAKEGVVLDNCFCTNSISAPSRASILTGLYSHRNRLYTLADSLDTSIPTLATLLQANGYHTGLVGKWHIQSQPQGFDYYSIFYDQGEYRDPTFIESTDPWPGNRRFGERVLGFSTDLVTEKAIRWMKEQDGNQPFLMCCHFKATHEPYDYPIRMEHLYDGVTFPEPETCWTGDRKPTAVLSKDRHWKSWNVAGASHHRTPTSGGVATPDCRSAPKGCNGRPPDVLPTKSLSVTTSVAALPSTTTSANS